RWRHRICAAAERSQQPQSRALDQLGCREVGHHGRRSLEHSVDHGASRGVGGGRGGRATSSQTGVSITAYMMMPEDVTIVADRLHEILSAKRPAWSPEVSKTPAADLTGRWDVHIEFAAGSSDHVFHVKQQANQLVGTHQGDFTA